MTIKTSKMIMYSTIVFSMLIIAIGANSAYAISEPDRTDYVSMWKIIDEQIRVNEKQITDDKLQLEEMKNTMPFLAKSATEKRISDAKDTNKRLWDKVAELEQLNIKSYQLDSETRAIFVNAEQKLQDKYLNKDSNTYVGKME